MQINWDCFKVHKQDAQGIRYKFEDLCRQLFANENLSGNKRYRYLHANPENAGLETEPIFDEENKRWIGFQAKFFDGDVDYSKIKHSAQKTIEYYTGKEGTVDLVYLFCNKPIEVTAKGYIDTKSLLNDAGIELQLITNDAILDLVRNKYPYLGQYYFGSQSIGFEWVESHSDEMFEELGERYNREFNVESIFTDEISLFVRDNRAADYLNQKKEKLLKTIREGRYRHYGYQPYLVAIEETLLKLEDVNIHTLSDAYNWYNAVRESVASCLEELEKKQQQIHKKIEVLSSESYEKEIRQIRELYRENEEIEDLISLIDLISVTDRERELLEKDVLILKGEAGIGKSQLLAWKTKEHLDEKNAVLLLVAGIYFTDDPIIEQIIRNLRLSYSFDELIEVLETIGEKDNRIVPVFIDALNETWNKQLWKSGLPSLIKKINESPMVKLVISYREEYEQVLLSDNILNHADQYVFLRHTGFEENTTPAVKEFLQHFNIPFSPIAHFSRDITNPLFLTLYCKTYNGDEVSLSTLFERVIKKANKSIYKTLQKDLGNKGYSEEDNILSDLINEIALLIVSKEQRFITKQDLIRLQFWSDHGIAPVPYIKQLSKEQILYDSLNQEEYYYLSYDQMNDYFCAKAIMSLYKSKEEVREFLSRSVLGIVGNTMEKSWNVGLFVHACAMYAERFHEECIDIIDAVDDSYEKHQVINELINSFQWRSSQTICAETVMELIRKYPCQPEDVWPMVIGNSMKVNHPLNADFLHNLLMGYKLNKRDWLWTLYINKLTMDETDRLVQLIEMYDRGEKLEISSIRQIELLLTLLSWVLTSSNRWLRDYASKAMVEILKKNISLCIPLLEKFKGVDDPYVISRLYGVVFGACCKRPYEENIQALAEYVYENVFNQDMVYPDILLRDYARLIIERFLYEEPNYDGTIIYQKIIPLYNSEPIPDIEDQQYLKREWNDGLFWLMHSMRFDGMGMYGDFGRYVFQNALKYFDVDEKKIFNFAIYYILNELEYKEEYFGEYDKHCGSYDRHETVKVERIGKKYQWITMYNILARVSDHCKMIDRWNIPPLEDGHYKGPWDPYVRDFDPTLNQRAMKYTMAPRFTCIDDLVSAGKEENKKAILSTEKYKRKWLKKKGILLRSLKSILIQKDENGTNWVCLTTHIDTGRRNPADEKQLIWSWLYAYFITREQEHMIKDIAETGQSIITSETAYYHETYTIFNREYPWSPSCIDFDGESWVDASYETGEFEEVPVDDSSFSAIDELLRQCGYSDDEEDKPRDRSYKQAIKKSIGKILPATTNLLWEEEFDATKETPISYSVPCGKIIEDMHLRQLEVDGFYFDQEDKLAAFDADLVQGFNSVVIRKDILDGFLEKTELKLVWFANSAKEIFDGNDAYYRSEWETLFVYDGKSVKGELRRLRTL